MPRKMLGGIDLNGQRAQNAAAGSSATDLVTKAQLDALAAGLVWKAAVKVATTAAITLSGAQTIDGVSVVAGDRVLVKDQASAPTNGIYTAAAGSWTRATDLDADAEFASGVAVSVNQGTANGDKAFLLATDGVITVGTSSLTWTPMSTGTTYSAGNGLALSTNTFSVTPKAGGGLTVDGTGVYIDSTYSGLAKRYSSDVPASATPSFTHGLGTADLVVQVRLVSTGEVVDVDTTVTSTTITLTFPSAPTAGQYRVTAVG